MTQETNGFIRQRDLDPIYERLRVLDAHHEALRVGLVGSDDLPGGRLGQINDRLARIEGELARIPETVRTSIDQSRHAATARMTGKGIEWFMAVISLIVSGLTVAMLHFGGHG